MGRIHDEAGLLSPDQRASLETKLSQFETESSNQIVVATFLSLEEESLEDFSMHLAEKWKIGQAGKDNGVILLIFPKDHLIRIEVGYGLESVVPDAYASRIIEEKIKPNFRAGNFYEGIDGAVDSLVAATRGVYDPPQHNGSSEDYPFIPLLFLIFMGGFILYNFLKHGVRGVATAFSGSGTSHHWSGGGSSFGGSSFGGGGGSFGGGGASGSW